MGLNGSQKETVGCGAPLLQSAKENGDGGTASSSINTQNSIFRYPSWPLISFFAHIQTVQIRQKKKKININKWITEHAQCGANLVTLSVGVIRGAERGCCLDLRVSDRKKRVYVNLLKWERWMDWQASRGNLYHWPRLSSMFNLTDCLNPVLIHHNKGENQLSF